MLLLILKEIQQLKKGVKVSNLVFRLKTNLIRTYAMLEKSLKSILLLILMGIKN